MNTLNYKELYENSLIEIEQLKENLKKYTTPIRYKKYYENNKEKINEKAKEYREKTNYHQNISKDKIKEYSKRAYEKKKLKNILI